MKMAFWNCFLPSMKNWLKNNQKFEPFDANNQMEAQHMQRYWNLKFKNNVQHEEERRQQAQARQQLQ